jgi:hypothetical protein
VVQLPVVGRDGGACSRSRSPTGGWSGWRRGLPVVVALPVVGRVAAWGPGRGGRAPVVSRSRTSGWSRWRRGLPVVVALPVVGRGGSVGSSSRRSSTSGVAVTYQWLVGVAAWAAGRRRATTGWSGWRRGLPVVVALPLVGRGGGEAPGRGHLPVVAQGRKQHALFAVQQPLVGENRALRHARRCTYLRPDPTRPDPTRPDPTRTDPTDPAHTHAVLTRSWTPEWDKTSSEAHKGSRRSKVAGEACGVRAPRLRVAAGPVRARGCSRGGAVRAHHCAAVAPGPVRAGGRPRGGVGAG